MDVAERQRLKELEDQLTDVILVFDTTRDTLSTLQEQYRQFCHHYCKEHEDTDKESFDYVECALREMQKEIQLLRKKVEALHTKVRGTTDLVSQRSKNQLNQASPLRIYTLAFKSPEAWEWNLS